MGEASNRTLRWRARQGATRWGASTGRLIGDAALCVELGAGERGRGDWKRQNKTISTKRLVAPKIALCPGIPKLCAGRRQLAQEWCRPRVSGA
eukprot:scaffold12020_cov122-Isochrysis_galbana.AAC.2